MAASPEGIREALLGSFHLAEPRLVRGDDGGRKKLLKLKDSLNS